MGDGMNSTSIVEGGREHAVEAVATSASAARMGRKRGMRDPGR
jgi:hypothetical protein